MLYLALQHGTIADMTYLEELAHYQKRLAALEDNIKLGQELKASARAIMKEIEAATDVEARDLAALMKNLADVATKGAKLESDSIREKGKLMNGKPLEF